VKHQIRFSISAKGYCRHNAVLKSLFSTLKLELALDANRKELIDPNSCGMI